MWVPHYLATCHPRVEPESSVEPAGLVWGGKQITQTRGLVRLHPPTPPSWSSFSGLGAAGSSLLYASCHSYIICYESSYPCLCSWAWTCSPGEQSQGSAYQQNDTRHFRTGDPSAHKVRDNRKGYSPATETHHHHLLPDPPPRHTHTAQLVLELSVLRCSPPWEWHSLFIASSQPVGTGKQSSDWLPHKPGVCSSEVQLQG